MFRQFAVALALVAPLAAFAADTLPTRLHLVVKDEKGQRVRGLTPADFEVVENGQKRQIKELTEFAPTGLEAKPAEDPRYVALVTPAMRTPPRRMLLIVEDPAQASSFLQQHLRSGDVVMIEGVQGWSSDAKELEAKLRAAGPRNMAVTLDSRVAAAALQLARYPETKAIVVFGDVTDATKHFASRRGVVVTKADEADDLANYYELAFDAKGGGSTVQVRSVRSFNVRTWLASVRPLGEDDVADAVLAHHFVPPQSNELQVSLALAPSTQAGAKRTVKLQVMVPVRNLALDKAGADVTGGFDVLTSIGDGKGRFSRVHKQSHALKWTNAMLSESGDRDINYAFDVVLDQTTTQISVGVVDHRTKKTGFGRIDVGQATVTQASQ